MKLHNKQIGVGDVFIPKLAIKYVNDVLTSKRITYGPYSENFEKKFAKIHDVKYAIFCNSGTSALQVSLHALKKKYGWHDNDEVIVPALTFVATVNIVLQNNLKPVFVDVNPLFFDLDFRKIEEKITKRTKAIIPVHIGGHPAEMDKIMKIAKKYNLKVIEDSCETMFAKYDGKPVGSFGDMSCFSTYAAHIITTGVGGFICTSNPELAVIAKSLVNHGRDKIYISIDDDKTNNKKQLFNIVQKRFNFIDVGYSYRATELEAALGLAQLNVSNKIINKRIKNAEYLTNGLQDLSDYLVLPKQRKNSNHIYMFYPIIIKINKIKRDELTFFLEENCIETRFLLPVLSQPVYKQLFGDIEDHYPIAKSISQNGFYIGVHPGLSKKDLDYVILIFHKFFEKRDYVPEPI